MTFDILDGKNKVTIPFSYRHNFIVVEVKLFGAIPLSFIFDTGAENTMLLTREFADFVDIEYDLRIPLLGSDMSQRVYALVARSVEIELIGLTPQRRDILVLEENDLNLAEIIGVPVHGIIGGSFFKNTVVEIDYKRQRLILHKSESFDPPGSSFNRVPVNMDHNKPYISADTRLLSGERVKLKLLVDTGAGLPLLLHNNSHESLVLPQTYILGRLGVGLGGYIEGYVGRIASIEVGGIEYEQVLTSFHDLATTIMTDSEITRNGVIGNRLLHRMQVMIDYVHEEMYVKPRSRYNRKFRMDRSGLIIVATGLDLDEYVIRDLLVNSPAAEAGIQPGDKLVRFQGFRAGSYTLDNISRTLQKKEGKRIKLVVKRDGERIKYSFRLRKLI
jgi:predicted aspartyl protease